MPDPATPDELAAIYLRARDVPCPGCGYNRRDGVTASCPECDQDFTLAVTNEALHRLPTKSIVAATITMLLFSIPWTITVLTFVNWSVIYQRFASVITLSKHPGAVIEWHHAVNIIEVLGLILSILFSLVTLWAVRRRPHRASRWFAASALCMAIGAIPFAWWNFYTIVLT